MAVLQKGVHSPRGPLDWMGLPGPSVAAGYLRSRFSGFFEYGNCSVLPHDGVSPAGDVHILDTTTGALCHHDIHLTEATPELSWEAQYPAFRRKYDGIISVFLRSVQESSHPAFVINFDVHGQELPLQDNLRGFMDIKKEVLAIRGGGPALFYIAVRSGPMVCVDPEGLLDLMDCDVLLKPHWNEWTDDANRLWQDFLGPLVGVKVGAPTDALWH